MRSQRVGRYLQIAFFLGWWPLAALAWITRPWDTLELATLLLGMAVLLGSYFLGQSLLRRDAAEILREDSRPVRGFRRDQTKFEVEFVDEIEYRWGPFVAIGKPGQRLSSGVGAARSWLPDLEWQDNVG